MNRRKAIKSLATVGASLAVPAATGVASVDDATASTDSPGTQSTTLDDDYEIVVDSADVRRLELGSDVELFESFESGTGDTIFIIHIGSCTYMWAEYLDGSTGEVPLIYNEWHEIDFGDSDVLNGFADDRENWVGAHEVAESLNSDADHTWAEVAVSGALAYITSPWTTAPAMAASMAYAYLSNSSKSFDVHTNFWNWNEAPDGPQYGTSRFSRAQFNVPGGNVGTVDITDRARSYGSYNDLMEPEVNLSASVYASSSTASVSASDLDGGPVVTDELVVVTSEQVPTAVEPLLSDAAKKELEEFGHLKLRRDSTVGKFALNAL